MQARAEICHSTRFRCYVQQVELSGQIRESKLQRRAENLQSQCEAKLSQVYDAYTVRF